MYVDALTGRAALADTWDKQNKIWKYFVFFFGDLQMKDGRGRDVKSLSGDLVCGRPKGLSNKHLAFAGRTFGEVPSRFRHTSRGPLDFKSYACQGQEIKRQDFSSEGLEGS